MRSSSARPRQLVHAFRGSLVHHCVVGIPDPDMPGGSATRSLVGATSPTLAGGSAATFLRN